MSDISLTADVYNAYDRIFAYLFYDGKKYQYVSFRRENAVERATNETRNLFLPGSVDNLPYYPDDNHTLVIRPSARGANSPETEACLYLELNCTNYGLMIESKYEERRVAFKESGNGIKISLLDFINGFNTSYSIPNSNHTGLQIKFSESYLDDGVLDGVNNDNHVLHSFVYKSDDSEESDDYLILFYSQCTPGPNQKCLMQIYSIRERELVKINQDFDFYDIFECIPQYLNYASFMENKAKNSFLGMN